MENCWLKLLDLLSRWMQMFFDDFPLLTRQPSLHHHSKCPFLSFRQCTISDKRADNWFPKKSVLSLSVEDLDESCLSHPNHVEQSKQRIEMIVRMLNLQVSGQTPNSATFVFRYIPYSFRELIVIVKHDLVSFTFIYVAHFANWCIGSTCIGISIETSSRYSNKPF